MTAGSGREVDRLRMREAFETECDRFEEKHPRSRELSDLAGETLLDGVPMPFMTEWPGAFPLFVAHAAGAHVTDVDGIDYADFCLGDTGAMTGHAPAAVAEAMAQQAGKGWTHMLPTRDSVEVSEELKERFELPCWQFALSATDANRFALRVARKVTQRRLIAVFNWCYHGTVDEASVASIEGVVSSREPNSGQPVDPSVTTKIVEFNDLGALERALATEDVACVLAEPAMTNVGIVLPDLDFHRGLREVTRRFETLLFIDVTHTLCMGPGGCTRAWRLEPDLVVVGKAIASGIPAAAYGFSRDVAKRLRVQRGQDASVTGGIGGTLAGNALTARLMRVTLRDVLTEDAFAHMASCAERYEDGVSRAIAATGMPWHVTRLGARAEYRFSPVAPRTGAAAIAAEDRHLSQFMHLFALNRGILLTPFHNMVLMCPDTRVADVDRAVEVFAEGMEAVAA